VVVILVIVIIILVILLKKKGDEKKGSSSDKYKVDEVKEAKFTPVNRDSTVDMQSEKKKVDEEAVAPASINIERKDQGVIYPPDDEVSPQHAIWLANDNNATVDKSNNDVEPRQEVEKE